MATLTTIHLTLESNCSCGGPPCTHCPYCPELDPGPNHMDEVHPLPGLFLRQQQEYIDRIVAAHEAEGVPYFGMRSVGQ